MVLWGYGTGRVHRQWGSGRRILDQTDTGGQKIWRWIFQHHHGVKVVVVVVMMVTETIEVYQAHRRIIIIFILWKIRVVYKKTPHARLYIILKYIKNDVNVCTTKKTQNARK